MSLNNRFIEWIAVSKHSTQMGYGKLSEDQLRILEDLPGSAVELQVKDKVSVNFISSSIDFFYPKIKMSFFCFTVFEKIESSRACS